MCRGAEATPGLFSASTEPLCGSPQGFARYLTELLFGKGQSSGRAGSSATAAPSPWGCSRTGIPAATAFHSPSSQSGHHGTLLSVLYALGGMTKCNREFMQCSCVEKLS